MNLENIIGNEKVKQMIEKTVKTNNILHSYLFLGIEGIGKSIFAREFAKMLLCEAENKPCETCESCLKFKNNNHPDLMIIENEEKAIKIEQIRYLQQKISEKPIISNKKIYIINNSDTMTKEAQNCLLKTIEEPPEYATIILIASNENKLLNTIKSRCMKVSFNKIEDKDILNYIKENSIEGITPNMVAFCNGSIGKIISVRENKDDYLKLEELVKKLDKEDLIYILNNADILYKSKEIIFELLEYLNVLLLKTKEIEKINCIKYVEETKKRLTANSNYDMTIDNLLIKIWEEINSENYSRC